jgi:flagellar basal body-associated protein FliL
MSDERFMLRATVTGVATFLALLGVAGAVYVFALRGTSGPAGAMGSGPSAAGRAGLENVVLLEDAQFTTTLPQLGDRSVTFEYTITVSVVKGLRPRLEQVLGASRGNKMPVIREHIRRIIAREDYAKLRAEQLEDVKRAIRQEINALVGSEAEEDVIFDKWNVIA